MYRFTVYLYITRIFITNIRNVCKLEIKKKKTNKLFKLSVVWKM